MSRRSLRLRAAVLGLGLAVSGSTGAATVFATAAATEPKAAAAGQVHPGASLFVAHCALCRSAPDPERLAAELTAFLQTPTAGPTAQGTRRFWSI